MLSSRKEKDIKKVRREKNSALSVFREDLWQLPHRPLLTDHRKSHCFICLLGDVVFMPSGNEEFYHFGRR